MEIKEPTTSICIWKAPGRGCTLEKPKEFWFQGMFSPYSGNHKAQAPEKQWLALLAYSSRQKLSRAARGFICSLCWLKTFSSSHCGLLFPRLGLLMLMCSEAARMGGKRRKTPSDLLIIKVIRIILSGLNRGLFLGVIGVSSSFWRCKMRKRALQKRPMHSPSLWMLWNIFHPHHRYRERERIWGWGTFDFSPTCPFLLHICGKRCFFLALSILKELAPYFCCVWHSGLIRKSTGWSQGNLWGKSEMTSRIWKISRSW